MWCSACRQDVPGIAPPSGGVCCCARCGGTLARDDGEANSHLATDDNSDEVLTPRAIFDAWQLEDDENDVLWLLRPTAEAAVTERRTKARAARVRQPAESPIAWQPPRNAGGLADSPRFRFSSLVAWLLATAGMTAFTCGAALAGWSVWENRQELWTWGVPIAIGGQVALIAGLLMQLDVLRVGTRSKRTAAHAPSAPPVPHWAMSEGETRGPELSRR